MRIDRRSESTYRNVLRAHRSSAQSTWTIRLESLQSDFVWQPNFPPYLRSAEQQSPGYGKSICTRGPGMDVAGTYNLQRANTRFNRNAYLFFKKDHHGV